VCKSVCVCVSECVCVCVCVCYGTNGACGRNRYPSLQPGSTPLAPWPAAAPRRPEDPAPPAGARRAGAGPRARARTWQAGAAQPRALTQVLLPVGDGGARVARGAAVGFEAVEGPRASRQLNQDLMTVMMMT
jgi:hypothetical protein